MNSEFDSSVLEFTGNWFVDDGNSESEEMIMEVFA